MFSRSIYWFMCTFVAAAIATGYNGQDSNTGSVTGVPVHQLRIRNPREVKGDPKCHKCFENSKLWLSARLGKNTAMPPIKDRDILLFHCEIPLDISSAPGDHQTSTPATLSMPAQTITPTVDDYISLLRRLSPEEKNRILIEAAKQGAVGELEALLAAGADAGAADVWGQTALHCVAARGHEEVARRLLAAGAPVDARDSLQWTPLHEAACSGHAAVVRLLLAAGADHAARTEGEGRTPLHWAAANGHTEAAAALLDGGADSGARDTEGQTPLDLARHSNKQQVVELLQGDSGLTASTSPE